MGRKKSKGQSSNVPIGHSNGDSSDSNEKNGPSVKCTHIAKSVDFNQVVKGIKNGGDFRKNICNNCVKENRVIKGSDSFICLKCGTKACCKERSKAHFDVPRSDSHSLAFDSLSSTIWCHSCSCEINEKDAKNHKLSTCISSLNQQLSKFAAKEKSTNVGDKNDETIENGNDSSPRNGKKTKAFQPNIKSGPSNEPDSSIIPARGLINLGNTCYFNSVMQCLARTRPLLTELKEMDHTVDVRLELKGGDTLEGCLEKWDLMSECLYETLTSLLTAGSTYNPSKFLGFVRKNHPQFEGYDQHDSHELLRHTLDSIKMKDLRRYRKLILAKVGLTTKEDPKQVPPELVKQVKELEHKVTQVQTFIPEKTFKGKLVSRVECQECNHSSEYIEGFLDLSLPVLADKPHPPVARRKTGSDPLYDDNSKHKMSAKQKRMMKKAAKQDEKKRPPKEQEILNQVVDEVADEAEEVMPDQHDGTLGLDEEKPHESGYSSEKASSSRRGSPSSEEMRSSSPCDDSWSTVPQFTDSWLNSLPGVIQLPTPSSSDITPNKLNRPPTHIPLHSDGTPNLAHLNLHDSVGSTLNALCQDTSTIMEQDPDWRKRINQRYFNNSFGSENNESSTRIDGCESADRGKSSSNEVALNGRPDGEARDVSIHWEDSDNQKDGKSNSENTTLLPSINKAEARDVNRSMSPPFRRLPQMKSQVKRESDFSPVREEEYDFALEQSPLDSIQEGDSMKPQCNNQQPDLDPPKEGDNTNKLDERQPVRALSSTDFEQDMFSSGVPSLLDQSSLASRLEKSMFGIDDSDECSPSHKPFCPTARSQSGILVNELRQNTAPHNSLDSEENESANEKSMNTCSEEFPDELFPENPSHLTGENLLGAKTSELNDDTVGDFSKKDESLLESLPEQSGEGDFEPLLDSLPANSKLSIANPEETKEEPEPRESLPKNEPSLNETDRTEDINSKKLNAPEDEQTSECNYDVTLLMQKRESCKDISDCSVESCLRQFTSIEFMTGSNKVGCSACTERQNKGAKDGKTVLTMATKQLLIGQAPPILILHLKRFQVQLHSFRKLSKHVSFPLVLDLSPFCTTIGEDKNKVNSDKPMPYCLYGIVEHRGTLNSGHYVAYVKTGEGKDRRWFYISDSHVTEVTEERVLKAEAYLLFYSRITVPQSP